MKTGALRNDKDLPTGVNTERTVTLPDILETAVGLHTGKATNPIIILIVIMLNAIQRRQGESKVSMNILTCKVRRAIGLRTRKTNGADGARTRVWGLLLYLTLEARTWLPVVISCTKETESGPLKQFYAPLQPLPRHMRRRD